MHRYMYVYSLKINELLSTELVLTKISYLYRFYTKTKFVSVIRFEFKRANAFEYLRNFLNYRTFE